MRLFLFSLPVIMVLVSCNAPNEIEPTNKNKTWVYIIYSGGVQCDTTIIYQPPNAKTVLEEAGIPVFDTFIERMDVCAACGCPTYAASHNTLIKEENLSKAKSLGFIQKDPPEKSF